MHQSHMLINGEEVASAPAKSRPYIIPPTRSLWPWSRWERVRMPKIALRPQSVLFPSGPKLPAKRGLGFCTLPQIWYGIRAKKSPNNSHRAGQAPQERPHGSTVFSRRPRLLRRGGQTKPWRVDSRTTQPQHRHPPAGGRRRADHALELSCGPLGLEGRAGSGGGLHHCGQAAEHGSAGRHGVRASSKRRRAASEVGQCGAGTGR